jgi:predicted 3-demethylubiquinone-9 3-methyltransferase (glyoxalase superfamily)
MENQLMFEVRGPKAEVDYYGNNLTAVPEAEACGWLKDKYGFSWQIVPAIMGGTPSPRSAVVYYIQGKSGHHHKPNEEQ